MRKVKGHAKSQSFRSEYCLIGSAIVFLALLYGGITIHILSRGELSRIHDQESHKSRFFSRGADGDLSTHPHLQHHDLSSLLLEGLPPLRPHETFEDINDRNTHRRYDKRVIYNKREASVDIDAEERMIYLRGRMPID
jgi:hypothetical protein